MSANHPQQRPETPPASVVPVPATVLFSADEVEAIVGVAKGRPLSASTAVLSHQEVESLRPAPACNSASKQATVVLPPGAFSSRPPAPSTPPVAPARGRGALKLPAALAAAAIAVVGLAALAGPRLLVTQNRSWVAPTMLAKSDARVLEVASALERETARKSELSLRRTQTQARLFEIEEELSLESSFRAAFEATLRSDLADRRTEVTRLQARIADRARASAGASDPTKKELEAKLEAARQRVRLLEAALPGQRSASAYGELALRREYDRSWIESEKLQAEKAALTKALAELDVALEKNQQLLATIESSPYRRAIGQDTTVGFVPYENLAKMRSGAPLLACRAGTLLCTPVGTIGDVLPGEVRSVNPLTSAPARGQLVHLKLTRTDAFVRPWLFAGRAP